jgi:hypothetical protein
MNDDFFIISFITEDKLLNDNIKENTEDYDKIYSLVKKRTIFEKELYFIPDEYINNIYKSYKMNWDNIKNQFLKDFNRLSIYIDKKLVTNNYVFRSFIANYKQYNYIISDNNSFTYYKLLIMLCTQASFYFMYLYGKTFENMFRKIYENNDLHIVQSSDNGILPVHLQNASSLEKLSRSLHFKTKNNEIKFYAVLILYLKNTDNNEILNVMYLKLNIKFDLSNHNININSGIIYNTIL